MHLALRGKTPNDLRKQAFSGRAYRLYRSTDCTCAQAAVAYAAANAHHEKRKEAEPANV